MASNTEDLPKRSRIEGFQPDPEFVKGLLQKNAAKRDEWLIKSLKLRNSAALAAVEEALARMAGHAHLQFLQPGGDINISAEIKQTAMKNILSLAYHGNLLKDPALSQSFFSYVDKDPTIHKQFMRQLHDINPDALLIYQLLGVQLQIGIMLGSPKPLKK